MKFKFNRRKLTFRRFSYYLLSGTIVISCITNGIFAKFTTEDYGGDGARVADFGVVVNISGDLFSTAYNKYIEGNVTSNNPTTFDADENTVSVRASSEYVEDEKGNEIKDSNGKNILNNVIAPGTKNDVGINVSVTGTPETDCQLNYTLLGFETVYLSGGSAINGTSYGLMVPFEDGVVNKSNFMELVEAGIYISDNGSSHQTYTKVKNTDTYSISNKYFKLKDTVIVYPGESYMPIKYYINTKTASGTTKNLLNDSYKCDVDATTDMLKKFADNTFGGEPYGGIYCFGDLGGSKTYETGVTIDENFSITWEWPYHQDATGGELAWCNACDTILGYIAAGKNVVKAEVKENGTTGSYTNNLVSVTDISDSFSTSPDYNLDITFDYSITVNQVD